MVNKRTKPKIKKSKAKLKSKKSKIKKSQVSIEMIMLLALAIMLVLVVAIFLLRGFGNNQNSTSQSNSKLDSTVKNFLDYNLSDNFVVYILSPSQGSSFTNAQTVDFNAIYKNNTGTVSCVWIEDLTTKINGCDIVVDTSSLTVGKHTFEVDASDGKSSAESSVTFTITSSAPTFKSNSWKLVAPQVSGVKYINSFAIYNNHLYAAGTGGSNALLEWNNIDKWNVVNSGGSDITQLVVKDNILYGISNWAGNLYKLNTNNNWELVKAGLGYRVTASVVYNNQIYAGTGDGHLLKFDGTNWVIVANSLAAKCENPEQNQENIIIRSLIIYKNSIYAGGGGTKSMCDTGALMKFTGNSWKIVAPELHKQQDIYSLVVYNNNLYGGSGGFDGSRLFKWNGGNSWIQVSQKTTEQNLATLVSYNNTIYGGTQWHGELFEWDGSTLSVVAPQKEDGVYILSMIVYNNKIYAGTYQSGELFEWYVS